MASPQSGMDLLVSAKAHCLASLNNKDDDDVDVDAALQGGDVPFTPAHDVAVET